MHWLGSQVKGPGWWMVVDKIFAVDFVNKIFAGGFVDKICAVDFAHGQDLYNGC